MTAYSAYSDQELAALLNEGDGLAFKEIFVRYQNLMLNFVYKKIRDRDEAKDILQDIFIQLWNSQSNLEIGSLKRYLFTAILNKIRDRYKHQVIHESHIDKLQLMINDHEGDTDYRIREKDLSILIEKEIAALPEKMRQVFLLRKNAFMSNKEIAEQLGISVETVETHMKRALKTLKHRLGPEMFFLLF